MKAAPDPAAELDAYTTARLAVRWPIFATAVGRTP